MDDEQREFYLMMAYRLSRGIAAIGATCHSLWAILFFHPDESWKDRRDLFFVLVWNGVRRGYTEREGYDQADRQLSLYRFEQKYLTKYLADLNGSQP